MTGIKLIRFVFPTGNVYLTGFKFNTYYISAIRYISGIVYTLVT